MAKFFVPGIDDSEAVTVLSAIAKFTDAPVPSPERRIRKITWTHNGERHSSEVGKPVDRQLGGEVVVAILERAPGYFICTPNRGAARNGPIVTSHAGPTEVEYFDKSR